MPTKPVKLNLPYPPQANHLYTVANGRKILSADGRTYKQACGWSAVSQRARLLRGSVAVTMHIYRPRRAGDIDNVQKAVLDSITGIAYEDDGQIVELHAYRHDDKANPRVELTVEEL